MIKVNGMSNKLLMEGLWVNHIFVFYTIQFIAELEYEMNVAQRCAIHLLFLQRV